MNITILREEGIWLINDHFDSLGSGGKERLAVKLQDVLAHPEKYPKSNVHFVILGDMIAKIQNPIRQ